MAQALKYPQLVLRFGIAVVFLWFGIDKFVHPQYWLDAWTPVWVQSAVGAIKLSPQNFMVLTGMFEVLTGLSLVTGFFMRFFAAAGALFLAVVMAVNGVPLILVHDIGLIGGLVAIALWPERSYV